MDSREGFLLEAGIGRSVHAESMVNQSGIDLHRQSESHPDSKLQQFKT